jgi:hypothetical protein
MKHLSFIIALLFSSLFLTITSCSPEQVLPIPSQYELDSEISTRADFSGLEEKVKIKISEKYSIPVSEIRSCYYDGTTPEGWGRYPFTTTKFAGIFYVKGIIGEDIEA